MAAVGNRQDRRSGQGHSTELWEAVRNLDFSLISMEGNWKDLGNDADVI